MKSEFDIKEMVDRRALSRRAFSKGLASMGLAAVTLGGMTRQASARERIKYFTWAGYEVPQLHPDYVKKYGTSPDTSFFADEEEAFLKIRAGFPADVAHPCSTSILRWYEAGIIKPFDTSKLRSWNDLIPSLKNLPGMSVDGMPLFIPNDWGSHSVAYRTDAVNPADAESKGWELLLDPSLAGRIGMWDSVEAAVAFAAAVRGIKDTTKVTDIEFQQIKDVLGEQKQLLRTYWKSETEAEGMFASGELAASYFWSGPVLRLQKAKVPVNYMLNPKGGIISWVCGLVMPTTGHGDEQEIYDFVNAWTAPDAGKYLMEAYGYAHANVHTYDIVSPSALKAMGLMDSAGQNVQDYIANATPYRSWEPELLKRYVAMFEDVKLGE